MGKKNRKTKKKKDKENDGTKLDPRKRELAPKCVPKQSSHDQIGNLELDSKDYISGLPNDILYLIISMLPFEFAVQTACLSTQWKDVWQKSPLLAMVEDPSLKNIDKTPTNFLEQLAEFNRPRQNWGFKFNFGKGRFLLVAITPNNTLFFDFSSAEEHELSRPFDLLLPLNFPDPNLNYKQPSPEVIKVTSLHLKSVSFLACMAVLSLLSKKKLPFLQSLTIEKCQGLQSLNILNIREACGLSTLIVLDCPKLESISLWQNHHNLKSFRYRGKSVLFQGAEPKDDLMLDFRQGPGYKCDKAYRPVPIDFLHTIRSCHSLTICQWFFESIYWMLGHTSDYYTHHFEFLRELWWIDASMEAENIADALLCFLRECDRLERLYVTIDPSCYKLTNTGKLVPRHRNPIEELADLRLVKLEGFPNEEEGNQIRKEVNSFVWKDKAENYCKVTGWDLLATCRSRLASEESIHISSVKT